MHASSSCRCACRRRRRWPAPAPGRSEARAAVGADDQPVRARSRRRPARVRRQRRRPGHLGVEVDAEPDHEEQEHAEHRTDPATPVGGAAGRGGAGCSTGAAKTPGGRGRWGLSRLTLGRRLLSRRRVGGRLEGRRRSGGRSWWRRGGLAGRLLRARLLRALLARVLLAGRLGARPPAAARARGFRAGSRTHRVAPPAASGGRRSRGPPCQAGRAERADPEARGKAAVARGPRLEPSAVSLAARLPRHRSPMRGGTPGGRSGWHSEGRTPYSSGTLTIVRVTTSAGRRRPGDPEVAPAHPFGRSTPSCAREDHSPSRLERGVVGVRTGLRDPRRPRPGARDR